MRRIRAALAAILFTAAMALPAMAMNRVQWWYDLQPPSSWMNTQAKNPYVGLGQLIWDIVGRSNSGGFFTNLQIVPATGMYVALAPINSSQYASLYQVGVTDTQPFGSVGLGALPADPMQIFHQGLLGSTSASLGPFSAATTPGQSLDVLIECQIQLTDTTNQTVNFVSNTNVATSGTANRDRADQVVCQGKTGTQAVTPTVPAVDTGWVGVGFVNIPNGTASIGSGNITTFVNWNGFLPAGSSATFMDLSSNQTAGGDKSFTGITSFINYLQFSNASLTLPNAPAIAGDYQSNPGMLLNVASGSNGFQFFVNGASTGAKISAAGAFQSGSSTYGATSASVNGTLTVSGATFDGTTLTANSTTGYLALNSGSGTSGVRINYNNASTIGEKVFDGGTVNYSNLTATGLAFSGASTSSYTSTNATVFGSVVLPSIPAGVCLTLDSSHNIISAGGACGVATGSITSVSGTAPITANTASGSVTVGVQNSPAWAGASTTHSQYVYAPVGSSGWNVYVGTSSGSETKQNSGAIAIGTNWTEPTSGLVAGAASPTLDSSGYLGAPATAGTSSSAGGALGATTYFVKITYVNNAGETLTSVETSKAVAANNVLVVTSPVSSSPAASVGTQIFGNDEAYALQRSGNAFQVLAELGGAAPTFEADGGFIAGSSQYFPNYATVIGTVTATNFNETGASASSCIGTDSSKNYVSGSNCLVSLSVTSPIQNTGTTLAPIIGCATCLTGLVAGSNISVGSGSTPSVALVASPSVTNLSASGWLAAGSSSPSSTAGDVSASRSATTGDVWMGGATESAHFDYNVSHAHALTLTCTGASCIANLYANAFVTTSRRELKHDIRSLKGLDAVNILEQADWASFKYKVGGQDTHYGFIADDTPAILAGPGHDHFDAETTSTLDALAIIQQQNQISVLENQVHLLNARVTQLELEHGHHTAHNIFWYMLHPNSVLGQ